MKNDVKYHAILWFLAALLTACNTIVPLENKLQEARVVYHINYTSESDQHDPASFTLALLRTYNALHQIIEIAPAGDDTVTVALGEYLVMAVGSVSPERFTLQYMGPASDTSAVWQADALYACLPELSEKQINSRFGGYNWIDETYPVVQEAAPIYLAKERRKFLNGDHVERLEMQAHDVSQVVRFRFSIETDPNIAIDSVFAGISGVARRVQVISSAVARDMDQMGQTLFEVYPVGGNVYEGSLRCLGIFPSSNAEYEYAPGVLRLHIYASMGEISRYVDARVNLKEKIEEARLLVDSDQTGYYSIAERQPLIVIDTPLLITEENIQAEGDVYLEWVNHDIDQDENGDNLEF